MTKRLAGWMLAVCWAVAQEPSPVFRVTVDLIQVDAIVTDAMGRHVTDLRPEDIQVLQDGKPQKIAYFSYVETGSAPASPAAARPVAPMPAIPLRPEDTRRVIALVVDDLGITPRDQRAVRKALNDFVDRQMQPGDLVAILQTGRGSGLVSHQFSNDKRVLNAAIQGLRPSAANRTAIDFEPKPIGVGSFEMQAWRAKEESNRAREEALGILTFGSAANIVQGMSRLPGRKSLVLFSEGVPVNRPSQVLAAPSENLPPVQSSRTRPSPSGSDSSRILEVAGNAQVTERAGVRKAMNRLIMLANQAGVVLYAIDPSAGPGGYLGLDVTDQSEQVRRPDALQQGRELSLSNRLESHAGTDAISGQTGGLAMNPTDLSRALEQVMTDQAGYYLLAYTPQAGTVSADPSHASLHTLSVRVLRPGLTVRARSSFAGVPDRPPAAPKTPDEQLTEALLSPFDSGGVGVRVTPLFRERDGPVVQSLVHVEARDLQFAENPAGHRTAAIDLALATLSEDGTPAGKVTRRFDIDLPEADYRHALDVGIDFNLAHSIKPGVYQWRAAVRDAASGHTGSARQFIEVPDLANGRLALSGILMYEAGADADPRLGPSVRRFQAGRAIDYEYELFNARHNESGRMDVAVQARVSRDGNEVWSSPPMSPAASISPGRLEAGVLTEPGQYLLTLTATDRLADGKTAAAAQSMDFDLVAVPPAQSLIRKEERGVPMPPENEGEAKAEPEPPSTSVPDPLLVRLRERASESIRRRPNYTCVEMIERKKLHDGCSGCESSDRLRLEVAVVGGRERFAWPGTSHFEDKELNEMVRIGLVGSGDFAGASDFVFFSDLTRHKLRGEEIVDGRRVIRYDYTVPTEARAYQIRGQGAEAAVGFHGSFVVDAETLDLIRLEAYADGIPKPLKTAASSMAIDYTRTRIGASDFLLPSATELRLKLSNGEESLNATHFSSCRQFTAESKLLRDANPAADRGTVPQPLVLPPGLMIDTRLNAPITAGTSSVGDALQAVVTGDIRHAGAVVIPKGAVLNGRIKHFSEHHSPPGSAGSLRWQSEGFAAGLAPPNFMILVFEFTSMTFGGAITPVHVALDRFGGGVRSSDGRAVPADSIVRIRSSGPPNVILHLVPGSSLIPKGFWLRWRTLE